MTIFLLELDRSVNYFVRICLKLKHEYHSVLRVFAQVDGVYATRTYEFVQLDVFTQTPLAGNPLAIFPDARGLTDAEMQALAREMNLSETTFIFPRDAATEAREGKKVRIFTVEAGIAVCRASDARHSAVFVCVGIQQRSPPKSLST